MRTGFIASLIVIVGFCDLARAELFEIPLPITGTYTTRETPRPFTVDFGTEFSEIREGRIRLEGTIVAPRRGPMGGPWDIPVDGLFVTDLNDPAQSIVAYSTTVGEETYPLPESFGGEYEFSPSQQIDWTLLRDGRADGTVRMAYAGYFPGDVQVVGGTGTITSASLILDATAVPEPTSLLLCGGGLLGLLRRHRPV